MQTKLARIANIAKENPKESFTSLYHLLNEELLTQCHFELDGNKATGVDRVTKAMYEEKSGIKHQGLGRTIEEEKVPTTTCKKNLYTQG
jgi:hypothetical protein